MKFLIYIVFFFAAINLFSQSYGKLKVYNNGEIFYDQVYSEDIIDSLGNYLINIQFFDGNKRSIQLLDEGVYNVIKIITSDSFLTDQNYLLRLSNIAYFISYDVFNRKPVEIHLANQFFQTKKIVKFNDLGIRIIDGLDYIYYNQNLNRDFVLDFIEFLKTNKFLTNDGKTIFLKKVGEAFNFSYPITDGYDKNQEYLDIVLGFAKQISDEFLNGGNITIFLLGDNYTELKAISNF